MYYYKIQDVHYVAIVISEMNFITYFTCMFFKNEKRNAIYLISVSLSLTHIGFINYLTLKKAGVFRKLSIFCSLIRNILKS